MKKIRDIWPEILDHGMKLMNRLKLIHIIEVI